jgi:hypothetical protein
MCKSKAEGGRRCASHTRGVYKKALEQAIKTRGKCGTIGPLALAAEHYASTDEGYERIRSDILNAAHRKDYDLDRALTDAWLRGSNARPQDPLPPWTAG